MEAKMIIRNVAGDTVGIEVPGVNPEESGEEAVPMIAEKAIEGIEKFIKDLQERAENIKHDNTRESILEYQMIKYSKIVKLKQTVEDIQSGKITVREKEGHLFIPDEIKDRFHEYSANQCVVCGVFEGEGWDELKNPCQ
jgi:hypothetical protein